MRHRFHSICPYFAMFPEAFAQQWIERLTRPGDIVLDPFCGRGTAPFQSLLMNRRAVGCDVNPVAYCLTRAKTNAPKPQSLRRRLTILERQFEPTDVSQERRNLPEFFRYAFSAATLNQLLFLRRQLRWKQSDTDRMLAALILGILHGESSRSPSYLSNQMPRIISTKPAYSVRFWRERDLKPPKRDLFEVLRRQIAYRYESPPPGARALIFHMDMRELPRVSSELPRPIRCVITSPPYLDVTNFEEDQWLRLWFLGGPPNPTYRRYSKDDRHERPDAYWKMICDFWRCAGLVLDSKAEIIIRIGGKKLRPEHIADSLLASSPVSKRKVSLVSHEVSQIRHRQTDAFRPGSKGCAVEVDCHFRMR